MKTLGIIGGIGPEATIDYYRLLIAAYRERTQDDSYPSLIINSINLQKLLGLVEANDLSSVADYIVSETQKLARAGADFGILSSNTPHIAFDEIKRRAPLPLLSIVEATCAAAKRAGLQRLGLLGTRFTMQGRFYPAVFATAGITVTVPTEADQTYIHDKYMSEFVHGIILPATRARLLEIIERLRERDDLAGIILGGTELPLILRDVNTSIPLLDTTRIHVAAALTELLS